jgi:hypothetical protein
MLSVEAEVVKSPANSLVASAVRMSGQPNRMAVQKKAWQAQAWQMYDSVGELRYAANWVGNVCSRARLTIAKRDSMGLLQPVVQGPSVDYLTDLFDGPDGQEQMLKSIGIHLFIAGECYLVGRNPRPERGELPGDDIWEIVSTEEISQSGRNWQIDYGDGLAAIVLQEDETVVRLWNPHPRRHVQADSPVRAQLPNLRELLILSRHVTAQATSRLAGNGIEWVPAEMSFPVPPDAPEGTTSATAFQMALAEGMADALADPESTESLVPLVVSAPGEMIQHVTHQTFWSPFDEQVPALRNEAIRRLALGLDIPAEVMLGTADMNHWSAWQVEESSIKVVIEPMLGVITNCLTVGYLHPITKDPTEIIVADTAELRLRPNRSKEAIELWDRIILSDSAARRETGFGEEDAPSDDEFKQRLIAKVASGSATPEQVGQALELLGIKGIDNVGDQTNQARPDPSLQDHPTQDLPDTQAASLTAASEVLVFRALERAGNRLRSLKQTRPPVAAADTYQFVECQVGELDKVLADAWDCIPRLMPNIPEVQRRVITAALDSYCRHLLLNQRPYERAEMEHYLTATSVRALA